MHPSNDASMTAPPHEIFMLAVLHESPRLTVTGDPDAGEGRKIFNVKSVLANVARTTDTHVLSALLMMPKLIRVEPTFASRDRR
jgi:hypothetical protein